FDSMATCGENGLWETKRPTKTLFGSIKKNFKNAGYSLPRLVFWNVNSVIQLGLEYIWGDRQNMDHNYKSNNRIQTMIQVSF
ncbi:MAG: hypothetical protein RR190_02090, partial [Bacteroidales bacterium]